MESYGCGWRELLRREHFAGVGDANTKTQQGTQQHERGGRELDLHTIRSSTTIVTAPIEGVAVGIGQCCIARPAGWIL